MCFDLLRLSISVQPHQFCYLLAINLWWGKAQLFLEDLFQIENIAVFTKHQRNYDPIVARTDLTVGAMVSEE